MSGYYTAYAVALGSLLSGAAVVHYWYKPNLVRNALYRRHLLTIRSKMSRKPRVCRSSGSQLTQTLQALPLSRGDAP